MSPRLSTQNRVLLLLCRLATPDATKRAVARDPAIEELELQRAIEIVYAGQPERRVNVHRLLREGGLSYLEVARTLGISIDSVRKDIAIIQRALRKALARRDLLPDTPRDEGRLPARPPILCHPAGARADRAKWAREQSVPWQWTPPAWAQRRRGESERSRDR